MRKHLLVASCISTACAASAQAIIWTGSGSGNWSEPTNWDGANIPNATGETAELNDVTVSREVTQNVASLLINRLSITQNTTTNAPVNQLTLTENLSLSLASRTTSGNSAYTATLGAGVGVGQVVLNLNGKTLSIDPDSTSGGAAFAGTVNFSAAGSTVSATDGSNVTATLNFSGDVNVSNNAVIRREFTGGTSSGAYTVNFQNGSTLDLTNGTTIVRYTGGRSTALTVTATLAGTSTINNGAALDIENDHSTAAQAGNTSVTNSGTLTQAGRIGLQARNDTNTNTFANSGTWAISGTSANLVEMAIVATGSATTSASNSGMLRGSTSSDKLAFSDLAGTVSRLTLSNSGTIAPGNGSGSAGSVGVLTLQNIDVTFAAGTRTLQIDVAGSASADRLALDSTGTLNLTQAGNDVVNIALVGGFVPNAPMSWDIATAGTITGTFETTNLASLPDAANWSITYLDTTNNEVIDTVRLTYVPEPASLALLALGAGGLLRRRR